MIKKSIVNFVLPSPRVLARKSAVCFLLLPCFACLGCGNVALAQLDSADDTSSVIPFAPVRATHTTSEPAVAPETKSLERSQPGQQFVVPPKATADTHPAQAQERPPIPTPDPNDQLPPPEGTGQAKPSLAGRASFLQHQITNTNKPTFVQPVQKTFPAQTGATENRGEHKPNETSRAYLASFEDTFMALVSTCAQIGLVIDSMDSNQGKIIVHAQVDPSANEEIVLTVRETAPQKTEVSASHTRALSKSSSSIIDDLLLRVSSLVSKGGAL